jgi:L-threonylcarbamoyladenylate synthase
LLAAQLGNRLPLILDGGETGAVLASTIVDLRESGWRIIREGRVTEAEIRAAIEGDAAAPGKSRKFTAGNQLTGHLHIGPTFPVTALIRRVDPALDLRPAYSISPKNGKAYQASHANKSQCRSKFE